MPPQGSKLDINRETTLKSTSNAQQRACLPACQRAHQSVPMSSHKCTLNASMGSLASIVTNTTLDDRGSTATGMVGPLELDSAKFKSAAHTGGQRSIHPARTNPAA